MIALKLTHHLKAVVCQSIIIVLTLLQQKGARDGPYNCSFFAVSIKIIDSASKSIALGMHTDVVHKEQYWPPVQPAVYLCILEYSSTGILMSTRGGDGNLTRRSYCLCYSTCNNFGNKCKI